MAGLRSGRPWRRFRLLVLETYGPICCHGKACRFGGALIDLAALPRTPKSFSVEHLDPLSHGAPLMNLERCRPAHYACNSARGNRPLKIEEHTSQAW
jgi:hypothetical protein